MRCGGTWLGYARHFVGVLESEEETLTSSYVRRKLQNALVVKQNIPLRDDVFWVSHYGRGESALARPVWTHDGVNLALLDLEVYSFENLLAIDCGVEVFDVELAHVMTHLRASRNRSGIKQFPAIVHCPVNVLVIFQNSRLGSASREEHTPSQRC